MTSAESILLGVVQGLTEFLPISSSGHLLLFQSMFGMKNLHGLILFDLVCHVGTLLTILIFFSKQIMTLFRKDRQMLFNLVIGTLPLMGVAALLPVVEKLFATPYWLWLSFLITAALLFSCQHWSMQKAQMRRRDAFLIGCMQGVAVIPGISRSGSTIATAKLLGFSRQEAVVFSFLLAIPAILGGLSLKLLQLVLQPEKVMIADIALKEYFLGFIVSFLAGCCGLYLLMKIIRSDALKYFAWYCIAISLFCFVNFVLL